MLIWKIEYLFSNLIKKFKLINDNSDSSSEDDKFESSNQRLIKSDDEIKYFNLLNKNNPYQMAHKS